MFNRKKSLEKSENKLHKKDKRKIENQIYINTRYV